MALGSAEVEADDVFDTVDEKREGHVYLFYGEQGSGKTYTSMTGEEPIHVIDTELRADITAAELDNDNIRVTEPAQINIEEVDPDNPLEDAISIPDSLDAVNNAVIALFNSYNSGDIEGGTVVLDSATDLWDWCQEWGKQRLMEENDVNEANFRLENQFDWGMIKNKHYKIFSGLRVLAKRHGVNVVFTAREKERPDYTSGEGSEHYIKCERSVPFWAEVTVRFTKEVRKGKTRHVASFDKLGANNQPAGELVDPDFNMILECVEAGEIPDKEENNNGGL